MIPLVKDFDPEYGVCRRVSPRIRRVTANNPGPFTFTGTGTYIVGNGTVAVIDPGPDDPAHLEALLAAVEGETHGTDADAGDYLNPDAADGDDNA